MDGDPDTTKSAKRRKSVDGVVSNGLLSSVFPDHVSLVLTGNPLVPNWWI